MADNIDHILTDYFTGRLDANIKAGELVKQFGQAINQRHLDMWLFQRHVIDSVLQLESEQHIKTFRARYGNHDGWDDVAIEASVDKRTCQRWKDSFKNKLKRRLKNVL